MFDKETFIRDLAELVKIGIEAERERCIALCEGWLERFEGTEIQFTSARDYAVDAVKDIADLIRDGADPDQRAEHSEPGSPVVGGSA